MRKQHCNYMKTENTLLLEELLAFYYDYLYLRFLVYFARSALQNLNCLALFSITEKMQKPQSKAVRASTFQRLLTVTVIN